MVWARRAIHRKNNWQGGPSSGAGRNLQIELLQAVRGTRRIARIKHVCIHTPNSRRYRSRNRLQAIRPHGIEDAETGAINRKPTASGGGVRAGVEGAVTVHDGGLTLAVACLCKDAGHNACRSEAVETPGGGPVTGHS